MSLEKVSSKLDAFSSFIMDPIAQKNQKFAWASSVIFGCVSVGILHLASAGWRWYRGISENVTHQTIQALFNAKVYKGTTTVSANPSNSITPDSPAATVAVKEPDLDRDEAPPVVGAHENEPPKQGEVVTSIEQAKASEEKKTKAMEFVNKILAKKEELWKQAVQTAEQQGRIPNSYFNRLIQKEYSDNQHDLEEIYLYQEVFEIFANDDKLQIALKISAAENAERKKKVDCHFNSKNQVQREKAVPLALKMPIESLAKKIYSERAESFNTIDLIKKECEKQGYELNEFLENPEALDILFKSNSLRQLLVIYAKSEKIEILLNHHLDFLVKNILQKKNENLQDLRTKHPQEAMQVQIGGRLEVGGVDIKILNAFVCQELIKENRLFNEILAKPHIVKIFEEDKELKQILEFHNRCMADFELLEKANLKEQNRKKAKNLGLKLVREGELELVARMKLEEFALNPKQLAKEIKKMQREGLHGDKGGLDKELQQVASELLDLLDQGVYNDYREAYQAAIIEKQAHKKNNKEMAIRLGKLHALKDQPELSEKLGLKTPASNPEEFRKELLKLKNELKRKANNDSNAKQLLDLANQLLLLIANGNYMDYKEAFEKEQQKLKKKT